MKDFEQLAARRRRLRLSQAAVSRASGLSRTNVSNVERGEARPELVGRVRAALEVLEKTPAAVLTGPGDAEAFARERREARDQKNSRRGRSSFPARCLRSGAAALSATGLALVFSLGCATAPIVAPPANLEPGTVGHLVAVCSGANLEYCAGASKMIFDAAFVSRAICPPEGVTLGQVEAAIVAGLRDVPAEADAVVAAADALSFAWPCAAPVSQSRVNAANAALFSGHRAVGESR